jgi:hypothetical protein
MYVRLPLSVRDVGDQLFERGIDIAAKSRVIGGTGSADVRR